MHILSHTVIPEHDYANRPEKSACSKESVNVDLGIPLVLTKI